MSVQFHPLSRVCVLDQFCELDPIGGASSSLFPQAEALLEQLEYQKALHHVSARKKMDRYWSMMDFLFCELFNRYRHACLRFYRNGGLSLRDIVKDDEQLRSCDRCLVLALQKAAMYERQRRIASWCVFRTDVLQSFRAAG